MVRSEERGQEVEGLVVGVFCYRWARVHHDRR
jgi:hypothetical protein